MAASCANPCQKQPGADSTSTYFLKARHNENFPKSSKPAAGEHPETGSGQVSRGFLAVPRMREALVIATTPSIGMNAFTSEVWLVPTRRPDDVRAAVPGAPPVQEGPPPAVVSD